MFYIMMKLQNRPFSSSPGPLFQKEGRCSAFDIGKSSFIPHANKTHFLKKGCAPSLILKVRIFGSWKWPIVLFARYIPNFFTNCKTESLLAFSYANHRKKSLLHFFKSYVDQTHTVMSALVLTVMQTASRFFFHFVYL